MLRRKFPAKISYRKLRGQSAMSFAEVAASSFLVIIMAALALDISLLIFAFSVNDKACIDVVRVAAQQTTASQAMIFASASIKNHKTDGVFISPIALTLLNYHDYGGTPPVGETPYVQVTTSVTVKMPVPLYFFGASWTNDMHYSQTYTSPIIKTKYVLP